MARNTQGGNGPDAPEETSPEETSPEETPPVPEASLQTQPGLGSEGEAQIAAVGSGGVFEDERDARIRELEAQLAEARQFQAAPGSPSDDLYHVEHTSLGGHWSHGAFVTSEQIRAKGGEVNDLLDLGAIRRATAEEKETQAILREKQDAQRRDSEERGRTPQEIETDVASVAITGNERGRVPSELV